MWIRLWPIGDPVRFLILKSMIMTNGSQGDFAPLQPITLNWSSTPSILKLNIRTQNDRYLNYDPLVPLAKQTFIRIKHFCGVEIRYPGFTQSSIIAIEGCCHGEIEVIYNTLTNLETKTNSKIDLLIICGDYEALRNPSDLLSLAVPEKYRLMGSFHHYYSGRLVAPMLTLVIGGNHEASSYFNELRNGGWLCHNIYYMGYASVVSFAGLRICGLSGIYKDHDYHKGHHEQVPFTDTTMRSIYHCRELDVLKLTALTEPRLDIMFSHDWPQGIHTFGNTRQLFQNKKHLRNDADTFGNPGGMRLLQQLRPSYWFSAHLHVKYAALYPHPGSDLDTRFLALDKVIPERAQFLQVIDVEARGPATLCYDAQWLSILYKTLHLTSDNKTPWIPKPLDPSIFQNLSSADDITSIETRFKEIYTLRNPSITEPSLVDAMAIPLNFIHTLPPYDPTLPFSSSIQLCIENPQTAVFNNLLKLVNGTDAIKQESLAQLDTSNFPVTLRLTPETAATVANEQASKKLRTDYKDNLEINTSEIDIDEE
eukprot:gene1369-1572_t